MPYYVGTAPTVTATFRNAAGALTDPTTATIITEAPSGAETSYTDGQLAHPSTGIYTLTFALTAAGRWRIGAVGTGVVAVTDKTTIMAEAWPFG